VREEGSKSQSSREFGRTRVAILCWSLLTFATPLLAQGRPILAVSISGGYASYDLAGAGSGFVGAAGVSWSPIRLLVVEPGISFFSYKPAFATARLSYLFPEISVQAQAGRGPVLPFVGIGVGGSFVVSGEGRTEETLHAAVGLRIDVGRGWGVRGEARARSINPWVGNTLDLIVGASRRIR
jgi:hypothetical protein